jgi:hypothetical protein
MIVGASSCGPPCSRRQWPLRGWWCGHGGMASICRWRPSTCATPTPSGHLLTHRSCALQPRPGPPPSSSRRRTSSHAHARSTNRDVEELERQLLEQKELDDIALHHELVLLGTRESTLDHHEDNLDREQKALEDACAQILAHELDANSREADLRDQEARLAAGGAVDAGASHRLKGARGSPGISCWRGAACLELPGLGECFLGILRLQPCPDRGRSTRSWRHAPAS